MKIVAIRNVIHIEELNDGRNYVVVEVLAGLGPEVTDAIFVAGNVSANAYSGQCRRTRDMSSPIHNQSKPLR